MAEAAPGWAPDAELREMASSFRASFQTVEEMALHFVREAILRGLYRPGERLPQDSIAEILGVSRMPVRSSLRMLESEGLVVFSAHRGATVRMLSADELGEIYDQRGMLEGYALEEAAKRLTPAVLAELRAIAEELRGERRSSRWSAHRERFYRRLYEVAERPRTVELIFKLRAEVAPYLLPLRGEDAGDHLDILDSLEQGDVVAAKQRLREHLDAISKRLQEHLRSEQPLPGASAS